MYFDESTHTYYIDGKPVPSVTQLVAPMGKDLNDLEDDYYLELAVEAAAERGTVLHAYIAHRLTGGEAEDFEMPSEYQSYADSVELFLSEHDVKPWIIETPLYGDGYAGTPDLVCEMDGQAAIVDYKFVSQITKSKVGAQLGGYKELCDFNGISINALAAIHFLRDGRYRLYGVDIGSAAAAFNVCRSLHRFYTQKHPKGRIFK